jgi:POT family proton-dependent oligopeptide transporter
MGRNKFIHIKARGANEYFKETFSSEGIGAIGRICVVFAFIIVFWSLFDQIGTTWLIQAKSLDRVIPAGIPLIGGVELLPAQISAVFNPLFILLLIPVFNYGVYPLINKVFKLTPLRKIGIGMFTMSTAFGMVAVVQMSVDAGNTPHMGWQILACALLTSAEVMVSITGLEFAYTQAPRQMKSFILSLFLLTVSLGNFLTAGVTTIITDAEGQSRLSMTQELWFWAGLILVAATIFIPVAKWYKPKEYLQEEEDLAGNESGADAA